MPCKERNIYILYTIFYYCNALLHCKGDEGMVNFVYRSVTVSPSGELMAKYTLDPNVAENFGGVLTCRTSNSVHLIPSFFPDLSAQKYYPHQRTIVPPLPPSNTEVPSRPTSHLF